ncbi:HCNGP-like protein [Niveomyces insectorum RCEF 264]|uniref:HCNGP-like protein n=1 Tax=Niveomyces insectorum RCEF 264 TaxID=1081102 RepID=A0A162MN00_9HYPO|nr:HCNGP-like protein [Niveomyces insectorum RCEF 264]
MAGLVAYASSDEDEEEFQQETQVQQAHESRTTSKPPSGDSVPASGLEGGISVEAARPQENETQPVGPSQPLEPDEAKAPLDGAHANGHSAVLVGPRRPSPPPDDTPMVGPSLPPLMADHPYDDDERDSDAPPPLSPYSAERAAVRELTLPRVPDFDIPPSPPGTLVPPAAAAAAASAARNKKFATFLELKRNKGTHFNARLAQSDAMKNPALMDKLLAFVGLEPHGWAADKDAAAAARGAVPAAAQQYASTLPAEVWDPTALPPWAYRRSLKRLQDEGAKQRARRPGDKVDFVPAAASNSSAAGAVTSQEGSRSGTPSATGKRKTRFD